MIKSIGNDSPHLIVFEKASMFLLAVYPILNAYTLFGIITVAQTISCILFICGLSSKRSRLKIYPTFFLIFWGYATIHLLLFSGNFKITYLFPGGISFCLYAISLGLFCKYYSSSYLYKYLKWVLIFAVVLFIYQYLIFIITGTHISVFLPISDTVQYSVTSYSELVKIQMSYEDRFASIFLEPSYFGQYALIVLTVELFKKENKNKLCTPFAVFIVIIELLIKSGVGLLGLVFVALIKLIYVLFGGKQKKKLLILFVLFPIIFWSVDYYLNSDIGIGVANRISLETNSDGELTDQSANERIIYGFWEYYRLDDLDKIIGTSISNRTEIGMRNTAINGFSDSLITYGWIGTIILLTFYYKACYRGSLIVVAFGILLLVVSFVETILFDDFMLLCTVIILNEGKNNSCLSYTKRVKI